MWQLCGTLLVTLLLCLHPVKLHSLADDGSAQEERPLNVLQPGPIVPNLKQNSFVEWVAQVINEAGVSRTTTPSTPSRACPSCKCGTINTVRRIVGGQETEIHQYPWMAMLLFFGNFYCGASLLNENYVVTAAHCVNGFYHRLITVRLLEHNRSNTSFKVIERRVAGVRIHERYSPRTIDNDIALLRLSDPVNLSEDLRPVCLPEMDKSFEGETAVVTGWGALSESGPVSDTLQEVKVPIISQSDCRGSTYGVSRITDNMLCAGYKEGGKDSCQGDSGGPLHVATNEANNQYQLAGIVSWGEGCAKPNSPGVYTRVNNYNKWILDNTRDTCYCQRDDATEGELNTSTESAKPTTEASTAAA